MPLQTLANLFSPTFKPAFSDFSFSSDCVYVSTAASSWWKLDLCNISRLLVRWHWQFFCFELMPKFHKQSAKRLMSAITVFRTSFFLSRFPLFLSNILRHLADTYCLLRHYINDKVLPPWTCQSRFCMSAAWLDMIQQHLLSLLNIFCDVQRTTWHKSHRIRSTSPVHWC